MATVYERAFLPEGAEDCLPDRLTIDELAYLRAGYFGGVDHSLYEELKARMNSMVRAGLLALEDRTEPVTTLGGWIVRGPFKGSEGLEFQPSEGTISTHGSGPISEEYEQEINVEVKTHRVVTRESAVALRVLDPKDWSDGFDLWLEGLSTDSNALRPDALGGPSTEEILKTGKIEKEFGPQCKDGKTVGWKSVWAAVCRSPDVATVKAKHGHYRAEKLKTLLVSMGYESGSATGRQYSDGKRINANVMDLPRSGRS